VIFSQVEKSQQKITLLAQIKKEPKFMLGVVSSQS